MINSTSILTNVKSFSDTQRALDELKKKLEQLDEKQNPTPTGEESDLDGEVGSVRVIQNSDNENLFEIKTQDGWKRPVVGNTPVTFKKPEEASKTQTKKSIDELETSDTSTGGTEAQKTIYDEKADKFILARPDYDSGWFFWDYSDAEEQNDGAYQLTHDLGVLPTLIKVYFAVGQGSGALGDKVEDSLVTNFQEITNGFSATWSSSSWDRIGTVWNVTNTTLRMVSGDSYSVVTASDWSGAAPAGYVKATDGAMKVLIWK